LQLPDNLIVDLGLVVPPSHAECYVSSIRVTPSYVSVGISSAAGGILVGTFGLANIQRFTAYPLTAVAYNGVSGFIVFGGFQVTESTTYVFGGFSQSGVERRAVRIVDDLPITGLLKLGSSPAGLLYDVTGVVRLEAGANVIIAQDSLNPQKLIVKLTPDAKYSMLGPCNDSADPKTCGYPPLRSINHVCPDENGRLTIRFE
jgi:hypothetical protein